MQLLNASVIVSPILTATLLCAHSAQAQIQPGGYTCSGDITLTHNNSLVVTQGHLTCQLPTSWAHWFNLANDPELSGSYSLLSCVDWSFHSSNNPGNQVIFIRVWQDMTPDSRDGTCGDPDTPGPDKASALLLWETSTIIPPSSESICGFGNCPPRADGDRSTEITGPTGGGLLLTPDIAFFVEVGHNGESVTRFGTNYAGEYGDLDDGPEQSWIKAPNCNAGGCTSLDWVKHSEWDDDPRDFVMQVHFNVSCGDTFDFPYTCDEDLNQDITVNVSDLLILLTHWGPIPLCGYSRAFGDFDFDNQVTVLDLLTMLTAWGECPNPIDECPELTQQYYNVKGHVTEGVHDFVIDGLLDGPARPSTNDIDDIHNGPTECGWFDYGVDGIPGSYRYGDAFGIDASTGSEGGDVWFLYFATCTGPKIISTQGACGSEDIGDTILEVYEYRNCPSDWMELIACDDSSATGCGDHTQLEIDAEEWDVFLIRIGGKFGEQGSGTLSIDHKQFGTPDCNNNGFLDSYDICTNSSDDCNRNQIPDECEIDCNSNLVPDDCDISRGDSVDCDGNGIPDECEPDCDGDGVNDACQAQFLADSGMISPFGGKAVASFLIQDLPQAMGDVTFSFFASANLAGVAQGVDLYMDGWYMTTVFIDNAGSCSFPGDREDFIYDSAFFNLLHTFDGNPDALIELVPVGFVDPLACGGDSFIQVTLKYFTDPTPTNNGTTQDCNGNGIWDVCDIADGTSLDHQGNGVPDGCEFKLFGRFENETAKNPD